MIVGWSSLYASEQLEIPFEQSFAAVDDPLIVLRVVQVRATRLDPALTKRKGASTRTERRPSLVPRAAPREQGQARRQNIGKIR